MKNLLYILVALLIAPTVLSQFSEQKILRKLKADTIAMDHANGDGVFKARHKKTKKWGIFQYAGNKSDAEELVPMQYDAVHFIPVNGRFTAVYNDGKVGFYLSAWSYDDARQTIPCIYETYQRFTVKNKLYLAVKKDGKWGWIDWLTGEEKSNFRYDTKDELKTPFFTQHYY